MILFPIYGFINKHKNSAQMHRNACENYYYYWLAYHSALSVSTIHTLSAHCVLGGWFRSMILPLSVIISMDISMRWMARNGNLKHRQWGRHSLPLPLYSLSPPRCTENWNDDAPIASRKINRIVCGILGARKIRFASIFRCLADTRIDIVWLHWANHKTQRGTVRGVGSVNRSLGILISSIFNCHWTTSTSNQDRTNMYPAAYHSQSDRRNQIKNAMDEQKEEQEKTPWT